MHSSNPSRGREGYRHLALLEMALYGAGLGNDWETVTSAHSLPGTLVKAMIEPARHRVAAFPDDGFDGPGHQWAMVVGAWKNWVKVADEMGAGEAKLPSPFPKQIARSPTGLGLTTSNVCMVLHILHMY